jgi:hypothetical protein
MNASRETTIPISQGFTSDVVVYSFAGVRL